MNSLTIKNKSAVVIALISLFQSPLLHATALDLETVPLFTTNSALSNLILVTDDSGSMDGEVLFPSNDGALWWNTANKSYVASGAVNGNPAGVADSTWKKFVYLFPNGTGTGKRVYDDADHAHFAIPPLDQFGYARSSAYNKMYYNPDVTYQLWEDYGSVAVSPAFSGVDFTDIDKEVAPSDPVSGTGSTFNLILDRSETATNAVFKFYDGMVIAKDTQYYDTTSSSWVTLAANKAITADTNIGIKFYPASYYIKVAAGSYVIGAPVGVAGDCSAPDASHYTIFHAAPDALLDDEGIDALGPDGSCLQKIEIKSEHTSYIKSASRTDCAGVSDCTYEEEIQNFANWFGYYRKRHLALRAGMGQSFKGLGALRVGGFTINSRTSVSMLNIGEEDDKNRLYKAIYAVDGNGGGTPNRTALKYAGDQFKRTDDAAPIQEYCQKNFSLLFTDGFSTTTDEGVGNQDENEGAPYEDAHSDTIADIAWKYYSGDGALRTDLTDYVANGVPTPIACSSTPDAWIDCNDQLHMNTYAVTLGAKGTIFGETHDEVLDAYTTTPVWPAMNTRDATMVDDLYHAAVNGRGEMFNAASADDLQVKLKNALTSIQESIGVASAVTFNTSTLETNTAVYLAFFNSGNWSGDLLAFELDSVGNVDLNSSWSAANNLDNSSSTNYVSPASRIILTYNVDTNADGAGDKAGGAFLWANLNDAQKADLNAGPNGNGADVLNFIRGERANEGPGLFRERASALGDVVNGSPVFVGVPNVGWPNVAPFPITTGERYADFKGSLTTTPRTAIVYTGGNDGMLHAFDASNGEELLAFIPDSVYSSETFKGLHYLADPEYQHLYYVDLPLTVSDVYIDLDNNGDDDWQTVLIGGNRAGGKGLFALDVTDPDDFTIANADGVVLWEFTHADDLGHTYSKPTIALLNDGRWAAIFGNGYNSTNGIAKLFIVYLEGGLDGVWTDGTDDVDGNPTDVDYRIISTGVGSPAATGTPNGLATPNLVDLDGNATADRVYAGDLEGNLWAFDISTDPDVTAWHIAYTGTDADYPNGKPLIVAKDSSGNTQPITSKPTVGFHPAPPNNPDPPNLLVYFGTGKYLEPGDLSDSSSQTFYGVWDHGQSDNKRVRSGLVEQTISTPVDENGDEIFDNDGNSLRFVTDNSVDYNNKEGWFIDLPASGERIIVNPQLRGSIVFFNTWIPTDAACGAGGTGFLMTVEQLNGGAPDTPVFDVNGDGIIDETDVINGIAPAGLKYNNGLPAPSTMLGDKQYTPGTGSDVIDVRDIQALEGADTGRLSWKEL